MNQTLLIELQTEELPPKALVKLGAAFAAGIVNGLTARGFLDADSVATPYATPRRLAVSITNVRATSPDKQLRDQARQRAHAADVGGAFGHGDGAARLRRRRTPANCLIDYRLQ